MIEHFIILLRTYKAQKEFQNKCVHKRHVVYTKLRLKADNPTLTLTQKLIHTLSGINLAISTVPTTYKI